MRELTVQPIPIQSQGRKTRLRQFSSSHGYSNPNYRLPRSVRHQNRDPPQITRQPVTYLPVVDSRGKRHLERIGLQFRLQVAQGRRDQIDPLKLLSRKANPGQDD